MPCVCRLIRQLPIALLRSASGQGERKEMKKADEHDRSNNLIEKPLRRDQVHRDTNADSDRLLYDVVQLPLRVFRWHSKGSGVIGGAPLQPLPRRGPARRRLTHGHMGWPLGRRASGK